MRPLLVLLVLGVTLLTQQGCADYICAATKMNGYTCATPQPERK